MSKKELTTKTTNQVVQVVDEKLLIKYLDTLGITKQLTENQKFEFITIAKSFQLNPFKREIYAIVYNTKNPKTGKYEPQMSVLTGYEVYLKRAERTEMLDGWKVWTEGSIKTGDLVAKIKIWRKDRKEPFEWEVEFTEYNQKRNLWLTKPKTMLKKVVMAQGFRLAFPDELGGMPYTPDEMPDHKNDDAIPTTVEPINNTSPEPEKKSSKKYLMSEKKWRYFHILLKKLKNLGADENWLNNMKEKAKKWTDDIAPKMFDDLNTIIEQREEEIARKQADKPETDIPEEAYKEATPETNESEEELFE